MVTLSFTIFSGQKNYNRAHMLFQVLCGFEPIFYTTHPNEESEKLDVVHIFPYAGTFTDNYIQVCSDGRTAHSIQGLQCHKGCAGESMGRA